MPSKSDALSKLESLQEAHDWIGNALDLKDNALNVIKAYNTDPKDVQNLFKVAGLYDEDVERLKRVLWKRAQAVRDTADAAWPPVKDYSDRSFKEWRDAAMREGEGGPSAIAARDLYFKMVKRFDYELRERISYMDMVIRKASEQEELYRQLEVGCLKAKSALGTMAKIPRHWDVDHQTPALSGYIILESVIGAVRSVRQAYRLLKQRAKAHREVVLAQKKENDKWMANAKALDAAKFVAGVRKFGESAKHAFGF
jgi:hypothetical protein